MLIWPDQWYILSSRPSIFPSLFQLTYYAVILSALPITILALAILRAPHMVLAGLFVAISGFALLPALFIAAVSLPTFGKITLISVLNFSVLCNIAAMALAKKDIRNAAKFRFLLGAAFIMPAWSILSVPVLYAQAALTANGLPYCVGFPSATNERVYTPNYNFWALRGTSLAAKETITTGSQDFQLSFHALLKVEGAAQYWNWSKTTMRFEPLQFPELWSDLRVECTKPPEPTR